MLQDDTEKECKRDGTLAATEHGQADEFRQQMRNESSSDDYQEDTDTRITHSSRRSATFPSSDICNPVSPSPAAAENPPLLVQARWDTLDEGTSRNRSACWDHTHAGRLLGVVTGTGEGLCWLLATMTGMEGTKEGCRCMPTRDGRTNRGFASSSIRRVRLASRTGREGRCFPIDNRNAFCMTMLAHSFVSSSLFFFSGMCFRRIELRRNDV
jgi:hypothetical protein